MAREKMASNMDGLLSSLRNAGRPCTQFLDPRSQPKHDQIAGLDVVWVEPSVGAKLGHGLVKGLGRQAILNHRSIAKPVQRRCISRIPARVRSQIA